MASHITTLLRSDEGSGQLLRRVQQLQRLQRIVERTLPEALRPHCRVAGVDEGSLLLHCDNQTRAGLIRYQSRTIVSALHAAGYDTIDHVTLRVRPPAPVRSPPPPRPLRISQRAAADIRKIIAEKCDDPALYQALQRLAAHADDDPKS